MSESRLNVVEIKESFFNVAVSAEEAVAAAPSSFCCFLVPDQKRHFEKKQLNDFSLDSQVSWSTVKKKPQRKKKACKSPKTSPAQPSFKTPPLSPNISPAWGPQNASLMDYMKPKKKKNSPQTSPVTRKSSCLVLFVYTKSHVKKFSIHAFDFFLNITYFVFANGTPSY